MLVRPFQAVEQWQWVRVQDPELALVLAFAALLRPDLGYQQREEEQLQAEEEGACSRLGRRQMCQMRPQQEVAVPLVQTVCSQQLVAVWQELAAGSRTQCKLLTCLRYQHTCHEQTRIKTAKEMSKVFMKVSTSISQSLLGVSCWSQLKK